MKGVVLFILSVVTPSTGFTSPSSCRKYPIPIASNSNGGCSYTYDSIKPQLFSYVSNGNGKETTTPTSYDPADAFTGESPVADLDHHQLVTALRDDKKRSYLEKCGLQNDDTAQCVDIVRDLNGSLLPVQYFAEKMNIENADSYSCSETGAFRGLMSNACRVRIHPGMETAFYKRIIFENIDHAREKMLTAPHKVIRDTKSYQVVSSFLSSTACQALTTKTGIRIPTCYDSVLEPNAENPIESKFSFLLEDLSPSDGWYQQWLLQGVKECKAALKAYAKIHAFFWNGSSFYNDADAVKELEAGVWKSASYVQPQFQTVNQCQSVNKGWLAKRQCCEKELSTCDYWDNLGQRLELVAEKCGRLAHPFAVDELAEEYQKYRTFAHGDPKQANLLFRPSGSGLEVGLIDFQWAGFGLAASDIAHFISSAVHADLLEGGGEEKLLHYYYDELKKYLVEYGAFSTMDDAVQNFSYDTFIEQYETGVLDICRLMIAYAWERFERVDEDDETGRTRTMNKTSYNKSVPTVVWLLSRCDEILKSRGV